MLCFSRCTRSCPPVFLYSCKCSVNRGCAAPREPESRGNEFSAGGCSLITTCPHSSYSIFQTSPLISCTFACSCPSDWRSPPGSLRIKEGGVLQISKSGSSRLFWPSNNFTSRDIALLACENADTNFLPLVHNEIGNIRQVMEPWSALFNS